ncbi:MAG: homoserine dehydrogenase [Mogibacterium sp.]|nr:homoserine dehydrogenase [Mogibacterium sp.]
MKIAIIGMGTVGKGAYETAKTAGGIEVVRILARHEIEGYEHLNDIITSDIADITGDKDIELVIESIGGIHPASEYVLECLRAGKHVVTPNKNLISACYDEIREAAAEGGAEIRFTATAGGGIPWLYNLRRTKRADVIKEVRGIVNGTCNFILDSMCSQGSEFQDVLVLAQAMGYAEADPSSDIEGTDTLRKTVISANLAFDAEVKEEDIPCYGIDTISSKDIEYLKSMGRVPRMMMNAAAEGNKLRVYVEPVAFPDTAMEASVKFNFNLITLNAEDIGTQSFYGQGAGMMPTGQSVIQDVMDIRDGIDLKPASGAGLKKRKLKVDNKSAVHRYYLRCDEMTEEIESIVAEKEKKGDICYCTTKPVAVTKIHEIAHRAKAEGRAMFIAALSE